MAANRNEDISAAATFAHHVIVATVAAVAAATTKRVARIKVPHGLEVVSISTNTSATAGGQPTVDVDVGGQSVLAAAINLGNNTNVDGVLHATLSRRKAAKNSVLTITATTPGGVTITDLTVSVWFRALGLRGGGKE